MKSVQEKLHTSRTHSDYTTNSASKRENGKKGFLISKAILKQVNEQDDHKDNTLSAP